MNSENPRKVSELLPDFIKRFARPLTDEESAAFAEKERLYAELEAKQERRRLEDLLASLGVLSTTAKAVASGALQPNAALKGIADQEQLGRVFLVLSGGVVTGKTVAAAMAAIDAIRSGSRAQFVKAKTLSTLSSFGEEAQRRLAELKAVPVLVVDDLGLEQLHHHWKQMLEDLVDHRWEEDLRTIITTNLPPATTSESQPSIRGVYGERIASRIRHKGLIVLCGTEDQRRRPE
jgi:DNA replication protein DnaC